MEKVKEEVDDMEEVVQKRDGGVEELIIPKDLYSNYWDEP